MIEGLVEEVFAYDFLLLVVLVELLMFDLRTSWGKNMILRVIIKERWRDLLNIT